MQTVSPSLSAGRLRPLRFAVGGPAVVATRAQLVDHVREAEEIGFDVVTFPDHLFLGLDPIVAMTVAAEVTTRVRVATLMLAAGLRNPILLAKQLASLDVVAEGRLDVGIGAGWSDADFTASGLRFESPGERIAGLDEAIRVLRGVWREPDFSFEGRKVVARNVPGVPAPHQAGGPPIMVGGGGRRILTLAGQVADTVTIVGRTIDGGSIAPDRATLGERAAWVHDAADRVGRTPELHILLSHVTVTTDRSRAAREICASWPTDTGDAPCEQDVLASPFIAVGSAQQIVDQLLALRDEFGVSYFSVRSTAAAVVQPVIELVSGTRARLAGGVRQQT